MTITLKNLAQATTQQVFDQVAEHLLTQGKKCQSYGRCLYLNEEGLKCAAGCLIAADEYKDEFEGKGWGELVAGGYVADSQQYLMRDLQRIHDDQDPSEWSDSLYDLTIGYGLNPAVLEKFE